MADEPKEGESLPLEPQREANIYSPEDSMPAPMYRREAGGGVPGEPPDPGVLTDRQDEPPTAKPLSATVDESGPIPSIVEAGPAGAGGPEEKKEEEEKKVAYEIVEESVRPGSIVDLKFKVPFSEWDTKTAEALKELRNTVVVDGFRKGKAPMQLIRNRYHKQIRQDTLDFLFANALAQIIEEKKYKVMRDFDRVDPEVVEGQDLAFSVSLEVQPQIEISGYDHFDLTIDTFEVNEGAVEAQIERLRHRHATYEVSELLGWEIGSGVTLDVIVTDDKGARIEEMTRDDLFLEHPDRSLPEPVVEEMRGKHAGDLFVVRVPNARKSEGGVLVSLNDTYRIKVREVKVEVLPDLTDAFAKDLGVESVEALRGEIRKQLTERLERDVRDSALEKIFSLLIERNPFEVPESLVQNAQAELFRGEERRLSDMGVKLEDFGQDSREYFAQQRPNAERMMRVMLINHKIAEKENIEVTDEAVDRAIARMAEREGRRPLAIRARLEAHKELDRFRGDLRYKMVDDFLLSRATISRQYIAPESKLLTPGGQ